MIVLVWLFIWSATWLILTKEIYIVYAARYVTTRPLQCNLIIKTEQRWDKVWIWIRQCWNFERFQQIRNSTNVLSALLSNVNLWKNPCSKTDFLCTDSQTVQANLFFLKFTLSHKLQLLNVQHNFCSVMCYTVLIWTLILLTLGNNMPLQSFNWYKPVHYAPTDKTNASISIHIRRCEFWPALSHQYYRLIQFRCCS